VSNSAPQPVHLLVVDDEPDLETLIRQKFRRQIRDGAYAISFAGNGQQALDVLDQNGGIDVIVTDINMPVMDGLTLLARLAERDGLFKAVVISAYGDMDNIRTAMNRGAFDFVTKPIDFADLEITIQKTVSEVTKLKQGLDARRRLIAVEQELDVAARIQESILPKCFPPFPNRREIELYAAMTPARQVGGDFYDFFFIDEHHLAFAIGDVSGKGVPAALFMAVCRTLIKATALHDDCPDSCLNCVNQLLCGDNTSDLFVTVFYGVLDTRTGEVSYTNAGHNPPYWLRRNGTPPEPLENQGGIVLGVVHDARYTKSTITLAAGDSLFLYTDGVTEAMNKDHDLFCNTRLGEHLARVNGAPLDEITRSLSDVIEAFTLSYPQHDDITTLAVRYWGN
jgi:sigma-B regulation protein RsbU (phosphoserine phosphatase)